MYCSEIYKGEENGIVLHIVEQATFHCPFVSIQDFPFEIQSCKFYIKIQSLDKFSTRLVAGNLTVCPSAGVGRVMGQYVISEWSIEETQGRLVCVSTINIREVRLLSDL